jgi:hypothetical protein
MTIALDDLITRRLGELSKVLAGCAQVDPIRVIPLISNLSPRDIQDERAKKYLAALQENYQEIQDSQEPIELVARLAIGGGFAIDYLEWLLLACELLTSSYELACEIMTEIQKLVNTRQTVSDLQAYADTIIFGSSYGNRKQRLKTLSR